MAILRGDLKYRLTPKSIERSYARDVTAGQSTFQQRVRLPATHSTQHLLDPCEPVEARRDADEG
jgi:hypothetical protein